MTVWQERKQAPENECESIRKSKDEIERKGEVPRKGVRS